MLGPTATVADALAQIRDPDWVVSIAAQVFVCQPPFKAPTGKFLGTVHFQRLLREPPSTRAAPLRAARIPVVGPEATDTRRRRGAGAATTCSPSRCATKPGSLLGAVTVDDVLDRQLGAGWRQRHRGRDATATRTRVTPW